MRELCWCADDSSKSRREPEGTAGPGLTLDADLAAHYLRQAPIDRQAESGAAVLSSRGLVRLFECSEQAIDIAGGDADAAVLNFKANQQIGLGLLLQSGSQHNRSTLGELD